MDTQEKSIRVMNHKTMRMVVGLIAIQMPFCVVILSGYKDLSSISLSYWTESRDLFVGSLIAVGFFLFAYNGTGNKMDLEYFISKVASVFAICIALFPMKPDGELYPQSIIKEEYNPAQWMLVVSEKIGLPHEKIHYISAFVFFLCLIFLMGFFAHRAWNKGRYSRAYTYSFICFLMIAGMISVYFVGTARGWSDTVFWLEATGLVLFGFGWLIAGAYHTINCDAQDSPSIAETIEITIDPKLKNNPAYIRVEAGEKYIFQAEGCWRDWFMTCDSNGWGFEWNPFTWFNRVTGTPTFLLCGNVGKDDKHAFRIGKKRTWTVPNEVKSLSDRQVYLFANDWNSRYENNESLEPSQGGPIKVTISRLEKDTR